MPHILVTNDDGVEAPGLLALAQALRGLGQVTVFAPNHNWSVAGHSKTMHKPLRAWPVTLEDGSEALTSDGAPSDCVALAALGLVKTGIDLVVSGINTTPNLGYDVTYSGTVAAAMEAAISGWPGIAVSLDYDDAGGGVRHWHTAAASAVVIAGWVLRRGLPANTLLNVNVPNLPLAAIKGYRATRLGQRVYRDVLVERTDPRGAPYYWIGGDPPTGLQEAGTDLEALSHGYVSVTPLHMDMTHRPLLDAISLDVSGL
ncbi:MAG: 5'/3'-nucleotidase SurE [Caldilineales bacterium]|nr:5'/3'-nucleotidase SurE [Caldilineales bacterium]MCW5858195.1 5'/3'-nucleotidase SurE [Caldilineales bacterium]